MSVKNYDVVIMGAGHNGLVAATYLARLENQFSFLKQMMK